MLFTAVDRIASQNLVALGTVEDILLLPAGDFIFKKVVAGARYGRFRVRCAGKLLLFRSQWVFEAILPAWTRSKIDAI